MTRNTQADGRGVEWPPRFDRTPESERTSDRKFSVTLAAAFSDLEDELERLDVDRYRYTFDARQRKSDKRPYSRANPDDPSFVLRWTMDGEQYAAGCDAYDSLRGNVRAVGLYLREKRKMENRPVATGASEFANARLPPGDDEAEGGPAVVVDDEPHEVLDVAPDAPDEVVRGAFRALTKELHPDTNDGEGDRREVERVKKAKEQMLGE